ncbi:MAG: hypothetical protein Q6362_011630, partial [Candidatus Wukongarchaeota archaeon]|nr:hypothetical protein [Candidatus Wukongarchaeota archaeon]
MQLDTDVTDVAPEGSDSLEGLNAVEKNFGKNKVDEITIIIHTQTANGVWKNEFLSDLATLNAKILQEHSSIINKTTCITNYMAPPYNDFSAIPPLLIPQLVDINNGNDTTLIKITLNVYPYGNEAVDWISDLRETIDEQKRE